MSAIVTASELAAAVDAYDAERCRQNEMWNKAKSAPMSDANKASIKPAIKAAIQAAHEARNALDLGSPFDPWVALSQMAEIISEYDLIEEVASTTSFRSPAKGIADAAILRDIIQQIEPEEESKA